jgi:glyoxylase-like metal-dependent hydrolase (beta-lactamase superfamily II)
VLEVNPGYFILRQNKCTNFEAPFIYIMLGPDGAFMHDTGASGPGVNQELLRIVNGIVGDRPLTVGHGHGHGDHTAGDSIFESRPNTRVIGTGAQAVSRAYGIDPWPTGTGQINLGGGRIIDVVPIPGHADDSVAFYDRHSRDMLTGDSLYPGNIFNGGDETFRASNRRLWEFAQRNGVRNVLGSHIEMTGRPGVNYPYPGRDHSASEQSLVLRSRHICQLAHADRTAANWPAGLPADCTPPYTPQEVEGIRQAEEAAGRGWQQQGDETVFPDFLVP